jgi:hypothetical protein
MRVLGAGFWVLGEGLTAGMDVSEVVWCSWA